uniref:Uncharacterized protein TCIL3000_4_2390 n=1 Tax=Trypanosoma congolense (strain IL3000) TaxID=1068625 RepID=G0UL93_TRYCI|nr:unnamed protein product [Trypanosoma congolense IL3000]
MCVSFFVVGLEFSLFLFTIIPLLSWVTARLCTWCLGSWRASRMLHAHSAAASPPWWKQHTCVLCAHGCTLSVISGHATIFVSRVLMSTHTLSPYLRISVTTYLSLCTHYLILFPSLLCSISLMLFLFFGVCVRVWYTQVSCFSIQYLEAFSFLS